MADRAKIHSALTHPNYVAFTFIVRTGEGTLDQDGYRRMFGGELFDVSQGWQHPNRAITKKLGGKPITSTAAGVGQFLFRTWKEIADRYSLPDFSPPNQEFAMCALVARRGALDDVLAGRLDVAIRKCAKEWASLPGSPYGQPTLSLEKAREVYFLYGGTVADPAELPKGNAMSPLVIPILQTLGTAIPALAKMFSSGSEVANRNIAAGQIIADKLVEVTQAVNLQEAAEKIQSNPEVLAEAKQAVAETVMALTEAGGGGIAEARKAASNPDSLPFWQNGAFWISLLLTAMPFMLLADVFYVHPENYDGNLRTQIVTGVLGVIAIIGAFWLGSSFSSQKKDSMLGNRP